MLLAKDIKLLERIQHTAARFVCRNYDWNNSVTDMLKNLKWDTLEQRRIDNSLFMLFKIVNKDISIDINEHLARSYTKGRKINNIQFRHIGANTDAYKNSYFPRTLKLWNKLDQKLVNSKNIDQFKTLYKHY